MKLQIVSDLHLEFQRKADIEFKLPKTDSDVIVMAGDIGVGFDEEYEFCKYIIETHQKPVIFVLGNHSFYEGFADVTEIRDKWRNVNYPGLVFLDEGLEAVIDGVTFIGGTMWTDFRMKDSTETDSTGIFAAELYMSDFRDTLINGKPWCVLSSIEEHHKTRKAMQEILDETPGKTVIVTHHLPSYKSIDPTFEGSAMNPAYASHMDEFIEANDIALWVHGHVHVNHDYMISDTRIISNPRGYYNYQENENFNPEMVVEI